MSENTITKAQMHRQAEALGKAEGEGINSRPELFKRVVGWAGQGACDPDTKSSDVEDIWSRYLEGRSSKRSVGFEKGEGKLSDAVQVSKLRVAAKVGAQLPAGEADELVSTIERVVQEGNVGKSMYDAFVHVGRVQCKEKNLLSEDAIRSALGKKEKADPTEADALEKECDKLGKLNEQFPSDALVAAIDTLNERIADLRASAQLAALTAEVEAAEARAAELRARIAGNVVISLPAPVAA